MRRSRLVTKLLQRFPAVIDYRFRLAEIEFDLSQVLPLQQGSEQAHVLLNQSTRRLEQAWHSDRGGIREALA